MRNRVVSAAAILLAVALCSPALGQEAEKEQWATFKPHKSGKKWYLTLNRVPKSVDEFKALRKEIAVTPQGGMVMFAIALYVWQSDADLGEKCMVLSLDRSLIEQTEDKLAKYKRVNLGGFQIHTTIVTMMNSTGFRKAAKYAANGYVAGTDVKDGYKLPKLPWKYVIKDHRTQKKGGKWDDTWHGFLDYTGAASPKPFYVKKNSKGLWKMFKASSAFAGTMAPKAAADSDEP
jgi:hypothetical protein